jgi:hypothetical protein
MFYRIEPYLGLVLMLATTAFAAWKGGAPERFGTGMIMAAWLAMLAAAQLASPDIPVTTYLVLDGLVAVGFLVVAVRYSSLWLGAAMIGQAILFGAHALRLSNNEHVSVSETNAYLAVSNSVGFLVLLILIGGTCATIQSRRRAAREKVEDRARVVKRPDWLKDVRPPTAGAL